MAAEDNLENGTLYAVRSKLNGDWYFDMVWTDNEKRFRDWHCEGIGQGNISIDNADGWFMMSDVRHLLNSEFKTED